MTEEKLDNLMKDVMIELTPDQKRKLLKIADNFEDEAKYLQKRVRSGKMTEMYYVNTIETYNKLTGDTMQI